MSLITGTSTTAAVPSVNRSTGAAPARPVPEAGATPGTATEQDIRATGAGKKSSLSLKPVRVDRNGDGVESEVEKKLAEGVRKARETMAHQDKDGNGKLEGAELTDAIKAADANGDGIVTRRELRRFNNKDIDREERFKGFDSDGDGALSGKELANTKWAEGRDKDGDGKVTLEEFLQGRGAKPTTGETAQAPDPGGAPTPAAPTAPAASTIQTASVGASVPLVQPSSAPIIL